MSAGALLGHQVKSFFIVPLTVHQIAPPARRFQNFISWLAALALQGSQSHPCAVSLKGPSFSSRKSVLVSWHQSHRTT
jgi:hypothetical protein